MEKISFVVGKCLIFLISIYRCLLSPLLGNCCRFYPSCSVYCQQAISRFGIWRGIFMALKRILCCHPWHDGGYDPVPEKLPNL